VLQPVLQPKDRLFVPTIDSEEAAPTTQPATRATASIDSKAAAALAIAARH
jgi:hypothetical protein